CYDLEPAESGFDAVCVTMRPKRCSWVQIEHLNHDTTDVSCSRASNKNTNNIILRYNSANITTGPERIGGTELSKEMKNR
ncbi:hypothetical protein L9F63_025162, partial [Diploptera punctata]